MSVGPGAVTAETLKLGGAGTTLQTMEMLGEALHTTNPTVSLQVVPNLGGAGGIKALIAGTIDLAVSSRLPTEAEMAHGLVGKEYGKTPFVLATARKGTTNLTLAQTAQLYAGTQKTWEDGSPIQLILRPAAEGDTTLLGNFSADIKQALDSAMAREGVRVAKTDQESADDIAFPVE